MYRAYWAIPRTMRTRSGEQVNTVFGVASMLMAIIAKEKPDGIVVCFDAGDETFRHQENETYKDGRSETPDDFYVQIPRVMELIDTLGLPHTSDPKYEADDLIAAYARDTERKGGRVTIVSGDRDLLQLVSDTVVVAIPHKGYQAAEHLGPSGVVEKFGVRPDQVAAFKGLSGDSSDNLPGVKGIGPKSASALLQEYETLDGIYDHLSDIKDSWRTKLEADKEQAYFCERMATLVCDMPLEIPEDRIAFNELPYDQVLQFFQEMEFTLLAKRLQFMQAGGSLGDTSGNSTVEVLQKTSEADQLALF